MIELDRDASRQTVMDREEGVYAGQVSTVWLDDATRILAGIDLLRLGFKVAEHATTSRAMQVLLSRR